VTTRFAVPVGAPVGVPVAGPADVPVDIGRDEAQRMAAQELADPRYHADDPSLLERGVQWVLDRLAELLERAGGAAPGGYVGLVALAVLVLLAVVVIRFTVGRVGRLATTTDPLFEQKPRTADQYRLAADNCAANGAWALAVRERLRAIVRDLEQRDLLEFQPGRTADEAAAQAGAVLAGCATDLREAAWIFDEVWYGQREATAEMDARLRAVDEHARRARPVVPAR
jgi:hypothetical protein